MTEKTQTHPRPLSPHLQVYRPQITTALSILHRATGVALTAGLVMMTWWLLAAAAGPEAYATFRAFASHPVGVFLMMGWSASACYHLCSGIRHLVYDTGWGFEIPQIYKSGYTVLAAAAVIFVAFWVAVLA